MIFKVFAGTMYCGKLNVLPQKRDRFGREQLAVHAFEDYRGDYAQAYYKRHPRVANYKHLRLQRVDPSASWN